MQAQQKKQQPIDSKSSSLQAWQQRTPETLLQLSQAQSTVLFTSTTSTSSGGTSEKMACLAFLQNGLQHGSYAQQNPQVSTSKKIDEFRSKESSDKRKVAG